MKPPRPVELQRRPVQRSSRRAIRLPFELEHGLKVYRRGAFEQRHGLQVSPETGHACALRRAVAFDRLRWVRADPCEAKVVILTGNEDPFVRRTCLEIGAEDVELKPPGPIFMTKLARLAGLVAA